MNKKTPPPTTLTKNEKNASLRNQRGKKREKRDKNKHLTAYLSICTAKSAQLYRDFCSWVGSFLFPPRRTPSTRVKRPAAALSHLHHKYLSPPPPPLVFTLLSAAPAHIKAYYCINQGRNSSVKYMRCVGGGVKRKAAGNGGCSSGVVMYIESLGSDVFKCCISFFCLLIESVQISCVIFVRFGV